MDADDHDLVLCWESLPVAPTPISNLSFSRDSLHCLGWRRAEG